MKLKISIKKSMKMTMKKINKMIINKLIITSPNLVDLEDSERLVDLVLNQLKKHKNLTPPSILSLLKVPTHTSS